jgi:hypothetical protein
MLAKLHEVHAAVTSHSAGAAALSVTIQRMPHHMQLLTLQQKNILLANHKDCTARPCSAMLPPNLLLLLLLLLRLLLVVAAFRACIKAHKLALLSQRAFWRCVMRDSLSLADMLDALKAMQQVEQTATYVYKRCDLGWMQKL